MGHPQARCWGPTRIRWPSHSQPVILTTPEQVDLWITVPAAEALTLQPPLPDGALRIVARGKKSAAYLTSKTQIDGALPVIWLAQDWNGGRITLRASPTALDQPPSGHPRSTG
jgi:hypothetical protein